MHDTYCCRCGGNLSESGLPFSHGENDYCWDCSNALICEPIVVTTAGPTNIKVTARVGESAAGTFTPIGSGGPSPVRFREAELMAFQDGSAATVTCGHCRKERPADHAVLISFGETLISSYFLCGPCLDSLAEGLYLHGAERGVPHWRKPGG